jgi:ABC-type transport system substrate-binding protein
MRCFLRESSRGKKTTTVRLRDRWAGSASQSTYPTPLSDRNYTQYCNQEVDRLLGLQSIETDKQKRRELVWQIEKLLIEDVARPIIDHNVAGTCWQPYVRGFVPHDNSIYNNTRFEDVWLDK